MSAEWRTVSTAAGYTPDGNVLAVTFGDLERRQQIRVDDTLPDVIRLWSVVARPAELREVDEPLMTAWRRNRLSELVGFTLDARGRMIGEAWVPCEGLTQAEWKVYVLALARACDRFEYLLTGRDRE